LTLDGATNNGVITYNSTLDAGSVESNLLFDGSTLTVTGDLSVTSDASVSGVIFSTNYQEQYNNSGNVSGTATIDLSTGNNFRLQFTGNTTIAFSNPPATNAFGFTTVLVNGGGYTITWPSSTPNVLWANGIAPVLSAAGTDVVVFYTYDGGATYYGFLSGANMS
jgi:hypothetical protein